MDYAFASVVSLDCNNSNGLWMYYLYVWTLDMSYVLNGVFVIVLWSYIYVMYYKLSIYT